LKFLSTAEKLQKNSLGLLFCRTPYNRLQDNSPTNQLAVSQVADWITRRLVNSPIANF